MMDEKKKLFRCFKRGNEELMEIKNNQKKEMVVEYSEKIFVASKYNLIFKTQEGDLVGFNTVTGGFLKFSSKKFNIIHKILNEMNEINLTDEKISQNKEVSSLTQVLIKGGFLVPKNLNELSRLKVKINAGKYYDGWLYLTILPTLNCNFKCTYCYELSDTKYGEKRFLDETIQERIKRFVLNRIKHLKLLHITWFGGEPLLNIKCIENLNSFFSEICNKEKIEFESHLVTNGYLLSSEVSKKLKEVSIHTLQITLDGPKEIHDKRRYLNNGMGTYDRILENISYAVEIFGKFKIGIRVNVDYTNLESLDYLLDDLESKGLKDKIMIDFGQVEILKNSENTEMKNYCMTSREFGKVLSQLYHRAVERGFIFPTPRRPGISNCIAEILNAMVIGPKGEIYKCWREVGEVRNICGYITPEGEINSGSRFYKWVEITPFDYQQCVSCKFLPICLGGCKIRIMQGESTLPTCLGTVFYFPQILEEFYYLKQKLRDKRDE